MDEIAAAAELIMPGGLPEGSIPGEFEAAVAAAVNDAAVNDAAVNDAAAIDVPQEVPPVEKKRIHRAKALTPKQAVTKFWSRGIYVIPNNCLDINLESPENAPMSSKYIIRCRCSPACKTSFDGWDAYAYNRHFTYKKHVHWEATREENGWDESEAYREFVRVSKVMLFCELICL